MIVVAFIGLLSVLMIPAFIKSRKQSQGKRIVNDARLLDGAIDAWAFENGKADGDAIDLTAAGTYAKSGNLNPTDSLGNSFVITVVGQGQVQINPETKNSLAGAGIDWGAY